MLTGDFFARTTSDLRPLHSAGCLPVKWGHVESKVVMPAVISSVKTRAIITAVPRNNVFGSQRMKQGKKFGFMMHGIIWSHVTFRKARIRPSADRSSSFLTIRWLSLDRSGMEPALLHFHLLNWIHFNHLKRNESVYNLISDVTVHHSVYAVTDWVRFHGSDL